MVDAIELLDQQIRELEKRTKENNEQPISTNAELLETMKAIKNNQDIERKRYERGHAVYGDEPINQWAEEDISEGQVGTFTFNVPEGQVFFWSYPSVSWNKNSTFYVYIDGALQPALSEVVQDMVDHSNVFIQPKKC